MHQKVCLAPWASPAPHSLLVYLCLCLRVFVCLFINNGECCHNVSILSHDIIEMPFHISVTSHYHHDHIHLPNNSLASILTDITYIIITSPFSVMTSLKCPFHISVISHYHHHHIHLPNNSLASILTDITYIIITSPFSVMTSFLHMYKCHLIPT